MRNIKKNRTLKERTSDTESKEEKREQNGTKRNRTAWERDVGSVKIERGRERKRKKKKKKKKKQIDSISVTYPGREMGLGLGARLEEGDGRPAAH